MKKKEFIVIMTSLVFTVSFCVGCSNVPDAPSDVTQKETIIQEDDTKANENEAVVKDTGDSSETIIHSQYIPIDYRENALIVQKSKDIELYGLLDGNGNTILEPKYDSLQFTSMNDKDYIKAKLVKDFGVLNTDGTESIKMGQYEEIVSAGDIGWLVKQNDKQFLINEAGEVTKELKGKYICCIGNQYLMAAYKVGDVEVTNMMDGSGDKSHVISDGHFSDIYDLDEKLLISGKSKNILLWEWLIDGNKFAALIQKGQEISHLKLLDASGEIITELADNPNASVVDVIADENKIILKQGLGSSVSVFEYDLNSGETKDTEFNSEGAWDSGIRMEKTGDFYQCYKDGELMFDERFADCSLRDGVLWLENTDSQWGVVDYEGKTIVPFGERGDRDSYTKILTSDGNFGFYLENNGNYEFHDFIVTKGKKKERKSNE